MDNIFKLIKYVINWQKENDKDFKPIPNDEHSRLIFNHENQIYEFIFSNKYMRDSCRLSVPFDLIKNYNCIIEQENGFTYYLITKGDN